MKSKNIVITSMILILLISIIVSVIGWNFRTYHSDFSDQQCKRSGSYCIFDGIPSTMRYTKPSESIKEVTPFNGNLVEYIYNIYESNQPVRDFEDPQALKTAVRISEINAWDISSYRCNATEEEPQIIEYFSQFCGGTRMSWGCGHGRLAIVCEDEYFIQDTLDYNTKLYGPYSFQNTLN